MQTILGLLANTDAVVWVGVFVALVLALIVVTRGPGWFWQGLCFMFGAFWMLGVVVVGKRITPPQWEGPGPEPTDIVDPRGRTEDHPDG
jgi:hypothetical protein